GHRRNRFRRRHLRPRLRPVPLAQGGSRLRPVRPGRRERGSGRHRVVLPRGDGAGLRTRPPVPRVPPQARRYRQHEPAERRV
ncbi:MAG: FIG00829281: hypothetical protein, partial [uncultured Nocardioides sp.]